MDVFGRFEVLAVTVVFYIVGMLVKTGCMGVPNLPEQAPSSKRRRMMSNLSPQGRFCTKFVQSCELGPALMLWWLQIGYTAIQLVAEVLIGDTTSLRNRVLFSFVPAAPFIVSGDRGECPCDVSHCLVDQCMDFRQCYFRCPTHHHLAMGHRHVGTHLHRLRRAAAPHAIPRHTTRGEDRLP
jgi:hypothetical protein